jgi:hypothetical protein
MTDDIQSMRHAIEYVRNLINTSRELVEELKLLVTQSRDLLAQQVPYSTYHTGD